MSKHTERVARLKVQAESVKALQVILKEHTAEYIVLACNSHKDLVKACEAWMKVESESLANHPCPDYTLRADYRKKAIKLTKAAIEKATQGD